MKFSEQDALDFAKTMAALGVVYGKDVGDDLIRFYELALSDVPVKQIKRNALRHMQTSQWFPKPAELRAANRGEEYALGWRKKAQRQALLTREDNLRIAQRAVGPKLIEAKSVAESIPTF